MLSPSPTAPRRGHILVAFCTLITASSLLALRYYRSAAFERPVHFSVLTLFIAGTGLYLWSKYSHSSAPPCYEHLASEDADQDASADARDVGVQFKRPGVLLLLILARTALFWRTIRTIHCSWDGLEALLPFILIVFNLIGRRPASLPYNKNDLARTSLVASGTALFVIVSFAWGLLNMEIYARTENVSGAICPPDLLEHMIPLAQLTMVLLDAGLMRTVSSMSHEHDSRNRIGLVCLISAVCLSFVAAWTWIDRATFRWSVYLSAVSVADLILDSSIAASGLMAGVYLIGVFPPSAVALTVAITNVLVHLELRSLDGTLVRVWPTTGGAHIGFVVFVGGCALLQHTRTTSRGETKCLVSKTMLGAISCLLFIALFAQAALFDANSHDQSGTIAQLVASARADSDRWIAAACESTSLNEAVREYERRYNIPPPPHFDKWYEFAQSVKAPVIDDYGQIHRDLLPFWGTLPVVLREQTVHLLEHPRYSFGGLIIRGGQVNISPHILGSHRWMMDVMKTMIEPFAQWLPDMQLAFNLDDECRISIPHKRMQDYNTEAQRSRSRLVARNEIQANFSTTQHPPWSTAHLDDAKDKELFHANSPEFSAWPKSSIFDEWIASACDPAALVNRQHWWDRKAACESCAAPHMTDGVVSNWTLAGDLCHQPDMAYLHGFLTSPSTMRASHTLFPVFSQSRISGFADILHPSPWSYGDKVAYDVDRSVPWSDKINDIFWRGTSSDGFAAHGAWQTFLRARFVNKVAHLDKRKLPASQQTDDALPFGVNVSFVGNFSRCDDRDCAAEHAHFYGSPSAEPPASLNFQEHWKHRHLMDLDGAGFSGRFIPFLCSASLPYRAALFRTWWEERVHPWRHFVPVDLRLSDIRGLIGFFGSRRGEAEANEIARQGADWSRRALRKEDMQVYMFRLLLEWGRLVDDRREEIGFQVK